MISDTVKHPQMALSVAASYIFRQDRDITERTTISDWLQHRALASGHSDEHHKAHSSVKASYDPLQTKVYLIHNSKLFPTSRKTPRLLYGCKLVNGK
jgi:hypothetical protein